MTQSPTPEAIALAEAIRAAGGAAALAKAINKDANFIATWKHRGKAPVGQAVAIELATNGKVTRYELRPDIFGHPPAHEGEAAT